MNSFSLVVYFHCWYFCIFCSNSIGEYDDCFSTFYLF